MVAYEVAKTLDDIEEDDDDNSSSSSSGCFIGTLK
jgi:hypothetical protein